jgi:hypothetical protein
VESQRGKGTTVYLNLPVAEGESAVGGRQAAVSSG